MGLVCIMDRIESAVSAATKVCDRACFLVGRGTGPQANLLSLPCDCDYIW